MTVRLDSPQRLWFAIGLFVAICLGVYLAPFILTILSVTFWVGVFLGACLWYRHWQKTRNW